MIQFGSYAKITEISFWVSATQPSGLILYTVSTELYLLPIFDDFVVVVFVEELGEWVVTTPMSLSRRRFQGGRLFCRRYLVLLFGDRVGKMLHR